MKNRLFSVILSAALVVAIAVSSCFMQRSTYADAGFSFEVTQGGDSNLNVTAAASVTQMAGPRSVDITVTFTNNSIAGTISNIAIQDDYAPTPIASLTSSQEMVFSHYVTQNELNKGAISLNLTWSEGSGATGEEPSSMAGTIKISVSEISEAVPEITLERTINGSQNSIIAVNKGEKIEAVYTLGNTSGRSINVNLMDAAVLGKSQDYLLAAGETKTVRISLVVSTNIKSAPIAAYTDKNGGHGVAYPSIKSISIEIAHPQLKISISAQSSTVDYGGNVVINYTFQNSGNVDFTNVKVFDTTGHELATVDRLSAYGKSITKSITATGLTENRTFKFHITGKETRTNTELSFYSNEVTVGVKVTADDLRLEISAETATMQISTPSQVNFSVIVKNISAFTVTNIEVSVDQDGTSSSVGTISSLEAGKSYELTYTPTVQATSSYYFTAKALDKTGQTRTFGSGSAITIELEKAASPAPTTTGGNKPTDLLTNSAHVGIFQVLLYILAVLGILMVVSGITYIVLRVIDKKSGKAVKKNKLANYKIK